MKVQTRTMERWMKVRTTASTKTKRWKRMGKVKRRTVGKWMRMKA